MAVNSRSAALVAFYTLLALLRPVFVRIAAANGYLQEGQISVDRLISILDLDPERSPKNTWPAFPTNHQIVQRCN